MVKIIDYKHPLIDRMKELYRDGRDTYELADYFRANRLRTPKDLVNSFTEASGKLDAAKSGISQLIEQMKVADDLPAEDRDYYVPFMGSHLENIENWHKDAQRRIAQLSKSSSQ